MTRTSETESPINPDQRPTIDGDKCEALLEAADKYIRQRWRGGCGTDRTNEPGAVVASTLRTVLRQVREGQIDPNNPDLVDIVLNNARRKLDTAQHYYRTNRAKKESSFVQLGDDFNPDAIFSEGVPVTAGQSEVVPYVPDEELETVLSNEEEKRFVLRFAQWCAFFESGLDETEQLVWFHWKMGRSVSETAELTGLTEYRVKVIRRKIEELLK